MIIGYLARDGNIYDEDGKFIKKFGLEKGEFIVEKDEEFRCGGVLKGNRGAFDKGMATLIRTDRRIILYRDIKPREKFGHEPFFVYAIIAAMRARELRRLGLKEYMEFYIYEIKKVKKGKIFGGRGIYVSSNGDEYHMVFFRSKKGTLESLFM